MGDPFDAGGVVALAVLGVLALFIVLRFTSLAAEVAVFVERLVRGRPELYGEGRGADGRVPRYGRTRTELAPRGKVFVAGEIWDAEADGPVPAGSRVEVTGRDGLVLRVRPARPSFTRSDERG